MTRSGCPVQGFLAWSLFGWGVFWVGGSSLAQTSPSPSPSRTELNTKAANVAAGVRAAQNALTPQEMAIADQVELGRIPCAEGGVVYIAADKLTPGLFTVQSGKHLFRMQPVVSNTGAIRLEDASAGGLWLQLPSKSMLMHQKTGSRIADECMTAAQLAVSAGLKNQPPISVFEPAPKP